jgi:hypothetical protein
VHRELLRDEYLHFAPYDVSAAAVSELKRLLTEGASLFHQALALAVSFERGLKRAYSFRKHADIGNQFRAECRTARLTAVHGERLQCNFRHAGSPARDEEPLQTASIEAERPALG